jgi:hypothetical protein
MLFMRKRHTLLDALNFEVSEAFRSVANARDD